MKQIEVDQDLEFQKKEWTVERVGWIVGLVIIIAALAGLFGKGPLSRASRQDGPLRVEWERISRFNSPSEMVVALDPKPAGQDKVEIWVSRDYYDLMIVNTISPEPSSQSVQGDHVVLEFDVDPASPSFTVFLELQPQRAWLQKGQVGDQSSNSTISFNQFLFP